MGQWKNITKDSGLEAAAGGQGGLGLLDAEEELAERNKRRDSRNRTRGTWRMIGHRTELRGF